jgi:hypothetical protein
VETGRGEHSDHHSDEHSDKTPTCTTTTLTSTPTDTPTFVEMAALMPTMTAATVPAQNILTSSDWGFLALFLLLPRRSRKGLAEGGVHGEDLRPEDNGVRIGATDPVVRAVSYLSS